MSLFLQILGALFLMVVLAVVAGVLFLRMKLRTFLKSVEGVSQLAATRTPSRIHLERVLNPDWSDEETFESRSAPLASLGFEPVGAFSVAELAGLQLAAWVHPRERVTAVVYEHPQASIWLDFYSHHEDGTRVTFSNTSQGTGVDHAPGHDSRRFPGLEATQLYARFVAERPNKPRVPMPADEFAKRFEKTYADEMDWRNSRGGPTLAEIRAVTAKRGIPEDENLVLATRALMHEQALDALNESIIEHYLEQSRIPAAEWMELSDRVLIVHDGLDADRLQSSIGDLLSTDEEDDETPDLGQYGASSLRSAFLAFNEARPAARRFRRMGQVDTPVAADLYVAPAATSLRDQ
jgi:hypothetical protein